jgi:hypothetical protein
MARDQEEQDMRNTCRDRSQSQRLHLYPEIRVCPACEKPLVERYRKRRWVVQLNGQVEVISHCLHCRTLNCPLQAATYRPAQEDALALRGYSFGLDVVARIGQMRFYELQSLPEIHQHLQAQLPITLKTVALLSEVFLALVHTVVQRDPQLLSQLQQLGGIVLAIDGVQPEKGNDTLYLLREVRLGRVLVARWLPSSAAPEIEMLIQEVLALGVPIIGVVSDKQESICLAVKRQLPGIPHQLCHYHYLKDLAQPVSEADRNFNKQLKHQVRRLKPIERLAAAQDGSRDAAIVRDYGLAIRQVLRQDGHYPLDPPGVSLFQNLQTILASLRRSLQQHPSELLERLANRLSFLPTFASRFEQLQIAVKQVRHIAELLELPLSEQRAQKRLLNYVKQQLKRYQTTEFPDLKAWLQHFAKLTTAFLPKLFTFRRQPLLPRTNNALEIFIGQLKKTRRKATGRKNVQSFILREGAWVAELLSLPAPLDWNSAFAQVDYNAFQQTLRTLRATEERRKNWQIRHHLQTYLLNLEHQWAAIE